MCPAELDCSWVVLAAVDVNDDGQITKMEDCSCRRRTSSNWHTCGGARASSTHPDRGHGRDRRQVCR